MEAINCRLNKSSHLKLTVDQKLLTPVDLTTGRRKNGPKHSSRALTRDNQPPIMDTRMDEAEETDRETGRTGHGKRKNREDNEEEAERDKAAEEAKKREYLARMLEAKPTVFVKYITGKIPESNQAVTICFNKYFAARFTTASAESMNLQYIFDEIAITFAVSATQAREAPPEISSDNVKWRKGPRKYDTSAEATARYDIFLTGPDAAKISHDVMAWAIKESLGAKLIKTVPTQNQPDLTRLIAASRKDFHLILEAPSLKIGENVYLTVPQMSRTNDNLIIKIRAAFNGTPDPALLSAAVIKWLPKSAKASIIRVATGTNRDGVTNRKGWIFAHSTQSLRSKINLQLDTSKPIAILRYGIGKAPIPLFQTTDAEEADQVKESILAQENN